MYNSVHYFFDGYCNKYIWGKKHNSVYYIKKRETYIQLQFCILNIMIEEKLYLMLKRSKFQTHRVDTKKKNRVDTKKKKILKRPRCTIHDVATHQQYLTISDVGF